MKSASDVYANPGYYELAFSWREIGEEVDVMEECCRRYSKILPRRVLELACGPAPHMLEFAERGYRYIGLDSSEKMLEYARAKASAQGVKATFMKGDMCSFRIDKPVEFAFVALGSLYARTTAELIAHLKSVADALTPGGLYLLDWCVSFHFKENLIRKQTWKVESGKIKMEVNYIIDNVDLTTQVQKARLVLDVDDDGKKLHMESNEMRRLLFPQEFLLLVEKVGRLEFIGWWDNWNLARPIHEVDETTRPIALLRRF
jgi:SAM-dependent methyltransferase